MIPSIMPKLKKSWTYYYMQIPRTDPWVQTELARPRGAFMPSPRPVRVDSDSASMQGLGGHGLEGFYIVVQTPIRCRAPARRRQ